MCFLFISLVSLSFCIPISSLRTHAFWIINFLFIILFHKIHMLRALSFFHYNNGFSLSSFFLLFLSFLIINSKCQELEIYYVLSSIPFSLQRLVFWHQEVASDSFCFLINSPWLSVFILIFFFLFFSGFNLYCWKGIHFS